MRIWGACGVVAIVLTWFASAALAAGPVARATRVGPAPAQQQLQLVLALNADLSGLQSFAQAVTTPGSPQYGRYESIATLARQFGASRAVSSRVISYLRRAGARDVKLDATGLFVDATMSAAGAARAFTTPLAVFHSARLGRFVAPTATARVPAALRGLVTTVVGLDTRSLTGSSFAHASKALRADVKAHAAAAQPSSAAPPTGTPSGCQPALQVEGFTPVQYQTAYGFAPLYQAGLRGEGERVALIEIDGFRFSDITSFASCFGLNVPHLSAFGVGVKHPLSPGGEATLDVEVLDAAAPNLKGIDVYESKPSAAATLRALTAPLQNRGFKPQVISASLGLCEPDVFLAIGLKGLRTVEGSLAMAAASGISFLASSGDQGSADCVALSGLPVDRLAVNYPSSSPWVTGVGGTNFALTPANTIDAQIVWNDTSLQPGAAGGGGTSQLFTRPSYQKGTVKPNRRFLPDVSMLADIAPGYTVFCSARPECVSPDNNTNPWQTVGGTSAATPLLAGGLALVDESQRLNGRNGVGFINPLLYKIGRNRALTGQVFSDVRAFSNDIGPFITRSHRSLGCCMAGRGFDRASGWGSVNLSGLASVALLLTHPHVALSLPPNQHPAKLGAVLATLSCSAACRVGAFADVQIGHGKPFRVSSGIATLLAAGKTTVLIGFGQKRLRAIRAGLHRHLGVTIEVFGRLFGSGNHVVKRTGAKVLHVHG